MEDRIIAQVHQRVGNILKHRIIIIILVWAVLCVYQYSPESKQTFLSQPTSSKADI